MKMPHTDVLPPASSFQTIVLDLANDAEDIFQPPVQPLRFDLKLQITYDNSRMTNVPRTVRHYGDGAYSWGPFSQNAGLELALNYLTLLVPSSHDHRAEPFNCKIGQASATAWAHHKDFHRCFLVPAATPSVVSYWETLAWLTKQGETGEFISKIKKASKPFYPALSPTSN